MALPKISYPINEIEFKSLNKKYKFRPITVREEKLLLIAKESENENDIFTVVKQVVNNCSLEDKFDVDKLPLFELEYAFLSLRMQSIGNTIKLSYKDNEDGLNYDFNIDLKDIKITYPKDFMNKIFLSDDVGITLKYPPASLYSNSDFLNSSDASNSFDEILYSSVENIWDAEGITTPDLVTKEELKEWFEDLDSISYRKIQDFFTAVPHMEYTINYTNKSGTDRKIELRTLNDFFIL